MKKKIVIQQERSFGAILGDGMKVVFRNFKPMLSVLLRYAGPILALILIFSITTGFFKNLMNPEVSFMEDNIYSIVVSQLFFALGIGIAIVIMNLIVYATMIDYYESDDHVTAAGIKRHFREHLSNYLVSILAEIAIFMLIVLVLAGAFVVSTVLFGLLYFFAIIFMVWLYVIIQFLGMVRIEEGLNITDGIMRCFYLLKNNWWSTFGLILVASMVGSMMMYYIMIFGMSLTMILGGVMTAGTMEDSFLLTILLGVLGILYVIFMFLSNLFVSAIRSLKYYDLVERKDARHLYDAIDNIGHRDDTIFANEGEY